MNRFAAAQRHLSTCIAEPSCAR